MMTHQTVRQLLHVFRTFHDKQRSGMPLHRAYQEAVHAVADAHSITYQTVGDGCRRRLGLKDIGELYELLAAWMKGDSRKLVQQLKEHSDLATHSEIEQFFAAGASMPVEIGTGTTRSSSEEESEVFQFRLPERVARMLKALAELEGISAPELIARTVSAAVRNQMAVVARGIINGADAHA